MTTSLHRRALVVEDVGAAVHMAVADDRGRILHTACGIERTASLPSTESDLRQAPLCERCWPKDPIDGRTVRLVSRTAGPRRAPAGRRPRRARSPRSRASANTLFG